MVPARQKIFFGILIVFNFLFFLFPHSTSSLAESITDLHAKISDRSTQIEQLQKEIDEYNNQISALGTQAQTLQNNLKALDLTNKKLSVSIALTENNIAKTTVTIGQLGTGISTTTDQISLNQKSISETLLQAYQMQNESPIEIFFKYKKISELWDALEKNKQLEKYIQIKSNELTDLKHNLTDKKTSQEKQKAHLLALQQDLTDQKKAVLETTQEKAQLLIQTKDQESAYKKILADKQAQKNAFEKELFDYESQLGLITNPNQIPTPYHGMINWPLDTVKITQLFGVTNASRRLYVSGSHNGVDFHAPIGTPVKAVLDGVIVGTGNTDIYKGCYSFGRWIMIKHQNGLSTIYGHLSAIKATVGQNVATGQIIGLSGYSGYVAPPGPAGAHLHLGVYATAGVEIKQFVNSIGCKQAVIPLADTKAYLDPMLYLPNY